MYNFWNYLDYMNKNLLYQYAQNLSNKSNASQWRDTDNNEVNKNNAFYIIWFIYRYTLNCTTLEQALSQNHQQVMQDYKLARALFSEHSVLYIDAGIKQIKLWDIKDVYIVLEILYNRYNLYEQLECFIKYSEGKRRAMCIKVLESIKKKERRQLK